MSSDKSFLALRLEGPLQAWGFDSQYNRRNTGLMPTKSAIAGMCCAALGYGRGTKQEQEFLVSFSNVRMTAIAIPRIIHKKDKQYELPVRRMQDYHTVGGGYNPNDPRVRGSITVSAEDGKPRAKNGQALAVLTNRQYLVDAGFGVVLEGSTELLVKMARALENPVWGLWLGRKACIPSAPVLAGLSSERDEALSLLIGTKPLESFTRQEEVESFAEGRDSLPDVAVSFVTNRRVFSPRRVVTRQAGEK
ncbi:type I-E CRISPR-associated protein Cas5/CasD [Thiovibrio sp. JS02]